MDHGRNTAKRGGDRLRIIFANGQSVGFSLRELVEILHRAEAVLLILVFSILLALLGRASLAEDMPTWIAALAQVFQVTMFLSIYPAFLLQAERWGRQRAWVRIYEPLVTASTTVPTVLATQSFMALLLGEVALSRTQVAVHMLTGFLFWEAVTTALFVLIGPAIRLRDIHRARARRKQRAPDPQTIRIGKLAIRPGTVRRIEAQDHYLVIHGEGAAQRVLGRLGDAAEAMAQEGMIVHRSHWVAFAQFGPVSWNGRSLLMLTASGETVPVARGRRAKVRAVLQRAGSV